MSPIDFINLFKGYGLIGIIAALALAGFVAAAVRLNKANEAAAGIAAEALKEANARNTRLEAEVALLNRELQNYLLILPRANAAVTRANDYISEAVTKLREVEQ